ncbi:exosortase P [Actinophytocola oryzae]|uniref:Exosortase/archaeosortase family protein n=1 Tax=Actinophytocola oryzae TaxID=502181 RepID=A0A4R7VSP1_9PSEU|nr:exosortase P [Actinophytocola oryzae]TDV52237.1 exosortase/archaeosortase family protein [Actinophytocola oryzae]
MTVALSPPLRWHYPLAALLLLAAGALVAWHRVYRTVEMQLAGGLIKLFTSDGVYVAAARQTVYFGLIGEHPFGLRMSPECTSAFLLLPLLLIGAVMILLRPHIAKQVLGALGIATVVLIVVNQLRLLMLVGLINWLGTDQGYYLGHTLFGSFVSVFGGAAALVLFVWLATRSRRKVAA